MIEMFSGFLCVCVFFLESFSCPSELMNSSWQVCLKKPPTHGLLPNTTTTRVTVVTGWVTGQVSKLFSKNTHTYTYDINWHPHTHPHMVTIKSGILQLKLVEKSFSVCLSSCPTAWRYHRHSDILLPSTFTAVRCHHTVAETNPLYLNSWSLTTLFSRWKFVPWV